MGKPFKLSLDIHGVVDTYPEKYIALAKTIKEGGGIVYICTGSTYEDGVVNELINYHPEKIIWWDKFFSVSDYIRENYAGKFEEAPDGGVYCDEDIWNGVKGNWAKEESIDLHIDDSPRYGKYFPVGIFHKVNDR